MVRAVTLRVRWKKILVAMSLAALTLVLAGVAILPEVRSFLLFKIAPAYARDHHLVVLRDPSGSEVYLIGTIHADHLESEQYSLWHLAGALEHLRPARLLVESRQEELEAGNVCDGPIEMGFLALSGRALGVPVSGIDYWKRDLSARRTDAARDDQMFERVRASLHKPGVTLIATGFSHVAEIARRLEAEGYVAGERGGKAAAPIFSPAESRLFPTGMSACLRRRIEREEQDAAARGNPRSADAAVSVRRRMLEMVDRAGEAPH